MARKPTGKTSAKAKTTGKAAPRHPAGVGKFPSTGNEKKSVGKNPAAGEKSKGKSAGATTPAPAKAGSSKSQPSAASLKKGAEKAVAVGGKKAAGKTSGGSGRTITDKTNLAKKKGRSVAEAASEIVADAKGYVFINGRRVRLISTKNSKPGKKVRNNGLIAAAAADAEKPNIKSIKTKLDKKQLNAYRDLLLQKRRELIGDLNSMETEALRSGSGNLSHMPIHMADIGTDTNDQDLMLGLAEAERKQLREIDGALMRIEDRTYGVCQLTGDQIPKARLEAKPWAKYTVEAARILEGQGAL